MTVVVTTSPDFGRAGGLRERLAATVWAFRRCSAQDHEEHLSQADVLIAGLPAVTAATLVAAPRLRAVLKHGVGLDAVDTTACSVHGIPVTNTPGAYAKAVTEEALVRMGHMDMDDVDTLLSGGRPRRTVNPEIRKPAP